MTDQRRPNVLYILTDDQGWDDLGLHGNPHLETPRLDALGRSSVQLANYYVAAVCAPSRASLLTGRHFLRTGVAHVHGGKDFVHPDEVMIGELFQGAGYATGMWGKWHSGKSSGYFPWERGFDEAYMAQLYKHHDSRGRFNGEAQEYEGWTVDTITELCIDFMRRHRDEPFFAFLPHLAPHEPLAAPEELIGKYEAKGLSRNLATVYAMIEQVDSSTGRLLEELEALGLRDDTIVVFHSDNGPAVLDSLLTDEDRATRYVNGYKGHKGDMWENGIKSACFVSYPRRFQVRSVERLVDLHDMLPTLCELCAVTIPDDHPPLDGRSIVPYLEGDEDALDPKQSFLWVSPGWPPHPDRPHSTEGVFDEYQPVPPEDKLQLPFDAQLAGIRCEQWKLMRHPGWQQGRPEELTGEVLIHISEDPKEDRNLADDEAEKRVELRHCVEQWFEDIKREPHSFHVPRFRIGREESNFVAVYAPERILGQLRNTVHYLGNWRLNGDAAEYRIEVIDAGSYRVAVDYQQVAGRAARLRLHHENSFIERELDGSGEQELGAIELSAGEQIIALELQGADEDDELVLERVGLLSFAPVA